MVMTLNYIVIAGLLNGDGLVYKCSCVTLQ
jgi:hypothetical protein